MNGKREPIRAEAEAALEEQLRSRARGRTDEVGGAVLERARLYI
jgi:hypothetical protein